MGIPGCLHPSSEYYRGREQPTCTRAKSAGILLLMTCLWVLASSAAPVQVRLANGPSHCAGRVEVLYNETWGTVCDDNWGVSEGRVVCRQLGCGALLSISQGARYGEGAGRIWLDEVNCTGDEADLSECHVQEWGEHNCHHVEDASVECADSGISELGPLQLLDGPNRCAGRVEVLHEHLWGTICDDSWDLADAEVVCRQLGCGTALSATSGAHFGRGHDRIWLDEVNCTGAEASLFECQANDWGENNCYHGEDAGVICSASEMFAAAKVRLVNGSNHCSGRVEILHNDTWAAVCDDDWDFAEARVVCRQLGCGTPLAAPGRSHFGAGSGRTWPDAVSCVGTEPALAACQRRPWGNHSCQHGARAGVVCSVTPGDAQIRLVNHASRCAGRVEVFYNEQWGTVCDDGWDLLDAGIVCRQLDCGTALSAPGNAQFGPGAGLIWLDEINCAGFESALSECKAKPWGANNCYHGEDAGVVCSDSIIPETAQVRLTNGSNRCAGRVEVFHKEVWGTVCGRGWDKREAEVVCRQLGCGTVLSTSSEAHVGAEPLQNWLDNVSCTGTETALNKCRASPWGNSSCSHGKYATVVCSGSAISSIAPVRLVDGPGRCAGRVEVLHDKQWGTVCDDRWDFPDAAVVCRQLGCGLVVSAPLRALFGRGQGPIWLHEVNCTGAEAALSECKAKEWGVHDCDHGEDAGVVCSGSGISDLARLRLANGSSECSGRVEVFHDERWGAVCDDGWDLSEAHVVCRQLGCGPALSVAGSSQAGSEPSLIWVDAVECEGSEAALLECKVKLWGAQSCKSKGYARVTCLPAAELMPSSLGALRLADGPNRCSGRVEVFLYRQWGVVCDDDWDLNDAKVVCKQLDCGLVVSAQSSSAFGQGSGPVFLDGVSCLGTEPALSECPAKPSGCSRMESVSVTCTGSGISNTSKIRLVGGMNECSGRVEVFYNHEWGTVCDDDWDMNDATVVCRQLGCGMALSALGSAHFGMGSSRIWLDDVNCTGAETDFSQCKAMSWGTHNCHHGEDAGVVCQGNTSSADLRLVNGPHHCAGRVEILHNEQWGTVCDDSWDLNDAMVVCRQLGCGRAQSAPTGAPFEQGSGPIWLDDVSCVGTEQTLSECRFRPWGQNNCNHGEDAGVVCSVSDIATSSNLRLVNGPHRCAGRVEVLHNEQWGTVCDDVWKLNNAMVVCRQLGCGRAESAPTGARFGQGSGPIWLDDVSCVGTEDALSECRFRPWGQNNCNHGEDAGVVCSGTDAAPSFNLRLVNGPHRCAGRVEVLHNEQWGTVCDDVWQLNNAMVVCRQLSCGRAQSAPTGARFGQGSGPIWLDDVSCVGTEQTLSECRLRPWGQNNCNHGEDAGVVCSGSDAAPSSNLRLVNGPNRCAGRVEVLHNEQWGTVCDDVWKLNNAMVVCRELGCGRAESAPTGAHFGQGSGPIWLDDVSCVGTEDALSECRFRPWGQNNCNHGEDAGVVCSGSDAAPSSNLRLVNGPNHCAGRVEVLHDEQWGTVCDDGWTLSDAMVVCRELGCGRAQAAPPGARFGQGSGPIWLDDVSCIGTEDALSECRFRPWGQSNCHHGEDAGVVCSDQPFSSTGDLRLVNGPDRCSGRVEVLHDHTWGTVCDDGWDLNDATVVCRRLGCGTAVSAPGHAYFGQGQDPIWLDRVACVGTETALSECRTKPWGQHSCAHVEDASVVCSDSGATNGSTVRLMNGPHRCAGRVEVIHNQQWGTVCDDGWDLSDAAVVCRQLGCGRALSASKQALFGQGSGLIWLDRVSCTGRESALTECKARPWGLNGCNHEEDAGVVCSGTNTAVQAQVRLANGPSRCAGRVEVLHDEQWGTVCDDGWKLSNAMVVCRQLGCGRAESAGARFGQGSGPIWLDDVSCVGTEDALSECRSRPWGQNNCHHGEDAGVVCSDPSTTAEIQVRLVKGPHRCAGRVEVLHNDQWGTVCDDNWNLGNAKVVCRQLGCGTAVSTPAEAHFGKGADPIWLDGVECTGTEAALSECHLNTWGVHDCSHEEDAGVVCLDTHALQLRVRDGPGRCAGRVEVLYNATWHGVCDAGWSLLEADVACRQLGCGAARSAPVGAQFGREKGLALLEGLSCAGSESLLVECQQSKMGPAPCRQGSAAGVVCTDPKDSPKSCSVLIVLLVLMMVLSGVLLWLVLKRRCLRRGAQDSDHRQMTELSSSVTPFQSMGAIYLPTKAESPEDPNSETAQLVKEDAAL